MRRREFIARLGAAAWPLAARAQQPAMPVIGFLNSESRDASMIRLRGFRQSLSEAGYLEGQNVTIEYRWADGMIDKVSTLATDLVSRKVAVIVANNNSVRAVMAATSTIPIVFVSGSDPVEDGLVANLNRPGGNVTGVSFTTTPLNAKRLELLHQMVPQAAVIAVLVDPHQVSRLDADLQGLQAAASVIGRQILIVKAASENEFAGAFSTIVQSGAGALLVNSDAFFTARRQQLAALALHHAVPTIYSLRVFVDAGGLMSYGASDTDAYRRAGVYVGRILKGAKPGDLPVELPTRYELVLNLKTARALGLQVPPQLLALADEVIE